METKFEARSRGGIPTLMCELVQEEDRVHLEYVIIAPFTSRGEPIGTLCRLANRPFPRDAGSAVYPKEIPDWCPLRDENKELEENNGHI